MSLPTEPTGKIPRPESSLRKEADEKVRQQQEWFSVTLASIGDAVITANVAGEVTFLNAVGEAMTGWKAADAIGQPIEKVFHVVNEHTREPADNPILRALREGIAVGLANPTILIARDGRETAIDDSAAPIRDSAGNIVGGVMVFHDVTQRRQAEAALRTSEERFRATFHQAAVGMVIVSLEGRFEMVNERFAAILGDTPEQLYRKTVLEVTHPDDRAMTQAKIARLVSGEITHFCHEKRFLRPDGGIIWGRASVTLLNDAQGKPERFVGVLEDITSEKSSDDQMREAATRLQVALSAGQLGDWSWDAATDRVELGDEAARIFGLSQGAKITLAELEEVLDEADREPARRAIREAIEQRRDYQIEYRSRPAERGQRWIAVKGRATYGADGRATGITGVVQDITDRKRAEEVSARLAAVVASSDDAILSMTLEGILTTWNQAAERMFGYTAEEIVGQSITKLVPSGRSDEEPAILEKLKRGERVHHYETERERKDGTLIHVSLSVSPILDSHGRIVGVSKISRDITERKRAEQALREESRILELLNHSGTMIASQLDLETVVQSATDAATALSGAEFGAFFYNVVNEQGESFALYTLSGAPKEAFEKFGHPRATDLFGPTFRGEAPIRIGDVKKDPRYGKMPPHHGMPPGHLPVTSYLAVPVISRSGEVIGGLFFGHSEPDVFTARSERLVVGVAAQAAIAIDNSRLFTAAQKEIAVRRRAEDALAAARDAAERANKTKDDFIAALSHELRTPLTPALIILSEAVQDPDAPAPLREDLQTVLRNVNLEARLIDDLLDLTRITQGKIQLRVEPGCVGELVQNAVQTCTADLEAKELQLDLQLENAEEPIEGDTARMTQILWNLLKNAIKFTQAGGIVSVTTHAEEGAAGRVIVFRVIDTGIGIEPANLARIFAAFEQGSRSIARQFGGLGLGLAISRAFAEAHGGTLTAESAGVGHGSAFTLRLPAKSSALLKEKAPVSRAPEGAEPAPASPPAPKAGLRILMVEDHKDTAHTLSRLLRRDGHEVWITHTVTEALHLAERQAHTDKFDLVISDLGLPDGTGHELMKRLRAIHPIRGIALSGYGMATDLESSLAAGFSHHLVKPINLAELRVAIAELGCP